jgi:hypothetical protein
VQFSASSLNFQYPHVSLKSSGISLRLLPRSGHFPIVPSIFPSVQDATNPHSLWAAYHNLAVGSLSSPGLTRLAVSLVLPFSSLKSCVPLNYITI